MDEPTMDGFLSVHEGQLLASKVPQHFWPTIFEKLRNQILDAGDYFQVIMEENNSGNSFSTVALQDLDANNKNNIFLIDHAWTFRLNHARAVLEEMDGLRQNLTSLFGIDLPRSKHYISTRAGDAEVDESDDGDDVPTTSEKAHDQTNDSKLAQIDAILDEIWRYAQTYTIRVARTETEEDDMPVWYLPDAFGIRIGHSFTPNCRMIPFFYAFDRTAYSLLFPISDIPESEEVTRNYLDSKLYRDHPEWQDILMNPWVPYILPSIANDFVPAYAVKDDAYFLSGRTADEIIDASSAGSHSLRWKSKDVLTRVVADDCQLIERFKNTKVQMVSDMFDADIIWLRQHFHSFSALWENNSTAFVNQFPYESCLTVKDLFASIVQSVHTDAPLNTPEWFPVTFNLQMELPSFVRYFIERERKGEDNIWIVKPWNLARGLDVHVTHNLNCVIRLAESGPKIVSKYIENPILFKRPDNENFVKFDLRYIVFLRNLMPLEIAIYDKFWIRFAVNEFNVEKLDDSLTHLTVQNYNPDVKVLNIECLDFIKQFECLYPNLKWADIHEKIKNVVKKVFETASTLKPPRGMAPNPQSRAMYGFDFMLSWADKSKEDVNVSFIEANFMPDCARACDFYPDFADNVFEALFFTENASNVSKL